MKKISIARIRIKNNRVLKFRLLKINGTNLKLIKVEIDF